MHQIFSKENLIHKMVSATKPIKIFFSAIIMLFSFVQFANAQEHGTEKNEDIHQTNQEEKEFSPSELINDHIGDSHDFHIADWNGHAISMPLPVILWSKNGLVSFMSSEFHHDNTGAVVVEKNGEKFVRAEEQIYQLNEGENTFVLVAEESPKNASKPLDFSITKNVFSMLMSSIILLLLFTAVARSYKNNKKAPKGIAGFLEPLVIFVRDDIAIPNIGEKKYARYMPYLLTVFFFVWINNLIGLVPFFPGSSNLTGNIVFTGVLAFITFIITTLSGNKNYWSHILSPPVPKALYPIMIPIEIIGMFTKPFALMIRLFANITAGHIIILSLVSLIFIFKTVAIAPVSAAFVLFMSVLELLVAALQAYVFTLLSALFIGQAVADDHH